jgi:hypothetical protein
MVSTADASSGSADAKHGKEKVEPTGVDAGRMRQSKKKPVVQQAQELCQTSTALPWMVGDGGGTKPKLEEGASSAEESDVSCVSKPADAANSNSSADKAVDATPENPRPGSATGTIQVPHITITPPDGEFPERQSPLMALADAAR